MDNFIDYTLTIQSDGSVRAVADGERARPGRLDDEQLRLAEGYIETARDGMFRNPTQIQTLGKRLYQALFAEPIGGHFREQAWRKVVNSSSLKIRLRLLFQREVRPEIMSLPWEFLYYPEGETFLATDPKIALSYEYDEWVKNRLAGYAVKESPLRTLFVHAHPEEMPVGFDRFVRAELVALGSQVELTELINPTLDALNEAFQHKPHVFHFLGHGALGKLALRDEGNGQALWYAGQSLGELLHGADIKLAVLQACEGGALSSVEPFAGTAAHLVQRHIPAVVAMRYSIKQPAAWKFVKGFYQQLASGMPVDVAVQQGRKALSVGNAATHDSRDFAAPLLWMRLEEGRLFPAAKAVGPRSKKKETHTSSHLTIKERKILEAYLAGLIQDNRTLDPGGIRQSYQKATQEMPLEDIYVGLQADRDRPDVDRRVMQEELDEIKKRLEQIEDPGERERQYQIWATQARTIQKALELTGGERVELSDIVQRHRQVVILGDPGAGKTTLLRYLALRFARALNEDVERLFEEQSWWDYETAWRLPDLGAVRLPILMRISKYAEARNPAQGGNPDLTLAEYLARYFVGHLQLPYAAEELAPLLRRCLDAGRCLILLDGLDEIIDPSDRREIASNISRFAGAYGTSGLPPWVLQSQSRPARGLRGAALSAYEAAEEEDFDAILEDWGTQVPSEVREEWKKRWKEAARGARATQMARELLRDARSAHLGNRFVVTSRIAGYHFARVGGEFEHHTIRPMGLEDIERFLSKWCPVAERRIAEYPDLAQVEQRARQEKEGILRAVREMPGVRRMAQNPLLLRILAIIHRNERHLPQRRIELYETATVTLLRDWNLERGLGLEVVIDEHRAMGLLGPVALWIHEQRPTGLLTKGEVESQLARILAREQGEDPENPSMAVKDAVEKFLNTVRQYSGLFVERGEGLFGFMHLTFEEYFTARQMVSRSSQAQAGILARLHQPRWREPTLLAVGFMSKNYYEDTYDLLRAILDHGSEYESVLHRDLLFAAACVGDSVNVAPVLTQEIARRLFDLYRDQRGAGRYRRLREQLKEGLRALNNEQGNEAVEVALAQALEGCATPSEMDCTLDLVEWLTPRSQVVAQALQKCAERSDLPRALDLLEQVRARMENGNRQAQGWEAQRENATLARFLAALWRYGWGEYLTLPLGLPDSIGAEIAQAFIPLNAAQALEFADQFLALYQQTSEEQRDVAFWEQEAGLLKKAYRAAPRGSEIERSISQLVEDLAGFGEDKEKSQATFSSLSRYLEDSRIEPLPSARELSRDESISLFQQTMREQKHLLGTVNPVETFEKAGFCLIHAALAGQTLISLLLPFAVRLSPFDPFPGDESLQASVKLLQADLSQTLLDLLRTTTDVRQYREISLFLLFYSPPRLILSQESEEGRWQKHLLSIVLDDLLAPSPRSEWALHLLKERVFHQHAQFSQNHLTHLLQLLDAPLQTAVLALDILMNSISALPDLLAWCWAVLQQPAHPLAESVREKLSYDVLKVEGTKGLLSYLDEGLQNATLRPVALEFLHRVEWQRRETMPYALQWLVSKDIEVRQMAALLLGKRDLYDELQGLLIQAADETLSANSPLKEQDEGSTENKWAALLDDAQVMRLLKGMWGSGWSGLLRKLLNDQWPMSFFDSSLLNGATATQALIPFFKEAAQYLATLEDGGKEEAGKEQVEKAVDWLRSSLLQHHSGVASIFLSREQACEMMLGEVDPPLKQWVQQQLSQQGLTITTPLHTLASCLMEQENEIVIAASLALMTADWQSHVVPILVECIGSPDDRVRARGQSALYLICRRLLTDGSSGAIEFLLHLSQEATKQGSGYLGTIAVSAAANVSYDNPSLVLQWLDEAVDENNAEVQLARQKLDMILKVSPLVEEALCLRVAEVTQPLKSRQYALSILAEACDDKEQLQAASNLATTFLGALSDSDIMIRRTAAYTLQWTVGQQLWPVVEALLQTSRFDSDLQTRVWALRSLGCLFRVIEEFKNVDISKAALRMWVAQRARYSSIRAAVQQLLELPILETAPDADAVLEQLQQIDILPFAQNSTDPAQMERQWNSLLSSAQNEWEGRSYRVSVSTQLPEVIVQTQELLLSPEPALRRAAACACAGFYPPDETYVTHLMDLLSDNTAVLWAMLDRVVSEGRWSKHEVEAKQLSDWLASLPSEERDTLIGALLNELDLQLTRMRLTEQEKEDRVTMGYQEGWPLRRVLVAILANLSEQLTHRAFTATRTLSEVVSLLAHSAGDPNSYSTRRFAIRALGNLQQFTREAADAFFEACQDVGEVYGEVRDAVTKFKVFGPGSLARLTQAVSHESVTVAYHAALLLGELGISRSEELGPEGRKQVADELYRILQTPSAERIVYDFRGSSDGKRVGPLYDVLYEALLQVVSGEAAMEPAEVTKENP